MEEKRKNKNPKQHLYNLVLSLLVTSGVFFAAGHFFPGRIGASLDTVKTYGMDMAVIFPPILVLMGLADVWIPRRLIESYLGQQSGWKGVLLSMFLGTLPTGPLFIAFPIAGEMLRKGARVANVVVFLGAWASLKMPQVGVEIQFLGLRFAGLRVLFTIFAVLSIGFITEMAAAASVKDTGTGN